MLRVEAGFFWIQCFPRDVQSSRIQQRKEGGRFSLKFFFPQSIKQLALITKRSFHLQKTLHEGGACEVKTQTEARGKGHVINRKSESHSQGKRQGPDDRSRWL